MYRKEREKLGKKIVVCNSSHKEMTYDEIATTLDIPIGTVKAQLHRSREQLFKIMSGIKDAY